MERRKRGLATVCVVWYNSPAMMPEPSRRKSVAVRIGNLTVGGGAPVVVQSMTNTDTADVDATVRQIRELVEAGSEMVRMTVNTREAARAVPRIVERVRSLGLDVPLIGDFHFNGHVLVEQFPEVPQALDKLRINPGTVGRGKHRDAQFARMIEAALKYEKPVRIGVNWGSLDPHLLTRLMDENAGRPEPRPAHQVLLDALVVSALESARQAESLGMPHDRIILSAKVSSVPDLIYVYRELARQSDYPLHLGLTEAGMGDKGVIASALGIGILLWEGIGDTIRVSLTPRPGEPRTREVEVAQQILQSLGLRRFVPQVTSCPGCGRTTSTFFQELAEKIQRYLRERMPEWRVRYPGVESLHVAVMGCVVNGPGESRHADIGISLPGTGEAPRAPVYVDGKLYRTLEGPRIAEEFVALLEQYVQRRFGDGRENHEA